MNLTITSLETESHTILLKSISGVEVKRMIVNDLIGWPLTLIYAVTALNTARESQGWEIPCFLVLGFVAMVYNFFFDNYQLIVTYDGTQQTVAKRLSKSRALKDKAELSEALSRAK
jgi:hypothetical protein